MKPLRILLVDDSAPMRGAVRTILASRPEWDVCGEASDGLEAIERANALRPDAILMDVSMPRMDGLQATRRIRAELPETKIIIISQNDPAIVRRQATEVGAHAYVGKSDLPRDIFPAMEVLFPSGNGNGNGNGNGASAAAHGSSAQPPVTNEWLPGSGEMGKLIRSTDWSKTSLGPSAGWSPALRMMVKFLLANRFPQLLWWGPQFAVLYNDAYIPVLGVKHPWALGKPCDEVWSEIWHVLKPLVETPFHGGPSTWMEDIPLEIKRRGFTEETHFTVAYSPVPDETVPGGIGGVLATVHEITEKVVAERRIQALRDLGARSVEPKSAEQVCEIAALALSQHSKDLPFVAFYLRDEKREPRLAGAAGLEASVASAIQIAPWPFSEVAETEELQVVSNLNAMMDGVPQGPWSDPPSAATVVPIRSTVHHQLAGFMVAGISSRLQLDESYRNFLELVANQVAASITNARAYEEERKRADALAEIDRAKTTFFSNVSHEFRTPLALMLGPLDELLAHNRAGLPSAAEEQLEMVRRNGARLLRLVNSLLEFSRIEADRLQASYQPTDLAAFTADLASVFRSATERAGLKLLIDAPSMRDPAYIDRDMWEKIVLNLLSNAFKFTFGGEIIVSLKEKGGQAELRVQDTGVGIAPQEMPRLFERFHRIENSRSRTHEGSGIGLALVQELVKLHGGTLRAESELGKGSTFLVTIPLGTAHLPAERIAKGAPQATVPAAGTIAFVEEALRWLPGENPPAPGSLATPDTGAEHPSGPDPSERATVLVADDNADMRDYLVRLLEERYEVEAVADGQAALTSAARRPPDLILSDVMMPELDGVGLLRELRAHPTLRETPVILLSARAGEESRLEGIATGADDYLIKPFSARELCARIETHLKLARVRREAQAAIRQKELELRATNERLNAIVDTTPECVKIVGADGTLLHMNAAGLQMVGAGCMEALVGQNVYDLVVPRDRENYRAFNERICLEGFRGSLEFEMQSLTGARRFMETHAAPLRNPDGSLVQLAVTIDISSRKRSEEALRQHRERFEMVADAARVGFWFCDLPFHKLQWDERVKEHFWLPPDAEVTIDTFYERLHPQDREPTRQAIEKSIANDSLFDVEYRTLSPEGKQKWIRATGRAFYDAAGEPQRFDGLTVDISEMRHAEERERHTAAGALAAEAKFRAIFEQTSVFAGIMTNDGTLIEANKLCLDACGYTADQVLGRPFWDCAWWRNCPESRERIREATPRVAQGMPYRETLRYGWADGSEHIVDFALYPIVDAGGRVLCLHPTGVDITEIKRAEEKYRKLAETLDAEVRARTAELETRNQEVTRQSDLLRGFSHRLLQVQDEERRRIARELHDSSGQTLTALSMNLATIARQAKAGGPEIANDAEDGMKLVQQLSQEIRTMSYLLHPPLLDEAGIASALQWYVQGFTARSGIEMKLGIDAGIGRLPSDMELVIFRIVQEALTNVHRHSGAKTGAIRISRTDAEVVVEIEDQGRGMSAETLAKIESQGSGVGLRGMRERVRQLHGKMKILSSTEGTVVCVSLPISQNPPVPEAKTASQTRPSVN